MSLIQQLESTIHSSYTDECKQSLLRELNTILPDLGKEYNTKGISPSNTSIMLRCLEQDPINKRGIILGMDPYPYNATGIPFEDPAFKQMSNKNIASNIARVYDINKEFIGDCNLYNLKDEIFLMNAALTVPLAKKGERSNSGAHFDLWHKFVKEILVFVLKSSPKCRFILVFGKSQHLSELSDEVITASASEAYKIISYHPCMATYFLKEESNPFQEVNALLRLLEEDDIKWYRVFSDFMTAELPEKREIDPKNTFIHLCKTLVIEVGDLNSYEALLGDLELSITNKVLDNESTVLELSKIYNRSLTEFNFTISTLLSSVVKPSNSNAFPLNYICGFVYQYGSVTIFVEGLTFTKAFVIEPMNFYFRERFAQRNVTGTFDLSITEDDKIPLNAYECLIELIYSSKIDFCLIEIIHQLMRKLKPITTENETVKLEPIDMMRHPRQCITHSGFGYLSYDDNSSTSPKGLHHTVQAYTLNNGITVLIRSLYSDKKMIEPNNRATPNPIFSLLLYIEKDYQKAYSRVNDFTSTDDILRSYDLTTLSPFHLAVSSVACVYPRAFTYELEIKDNVVVCKEIESKIEEQEDEYNRMNSLLECAKYKSAMVKKIDATKKTLDKLYASHAIVRQINRILKYLKYDTSV